MQTQSETPARTCCMATPPVIFLFVTLLVTIGTTALLCGAIMSDHWEYVTWDKTILEILTHNTNFSVEWQLNGRVAAVTVNSKNVRKENLYLVPMYGGIWTLCIDISESDMRVLGRSGFPNSEKCVNYLADEVVLNDDLYRNNGLPSTNNPKIRMQNLSISCSLVCMIILGSAALVGAFGVCQRQISAILVTGVMYLLAALFGLFTLMIIYVKRQHDKLNEIDYDRSIEGLVASKSAAHMAKELFAARVLTTSWSLSLGWCGVIMCSITSGMWIILSKIMRYNPFSSA